ncbi:MAG: alkylation response protein AidB-like acyl-CoA dehydrogenase [Myxococcota bacterium]|jgi:alkylation response protein AidB-like acyl-CoA dehydrogenase
MRFALSEEQVMFADAVKQLLAGECPPGKVRAAWEGEVDTHLWRALADNGIVGLLAPEEVGGLEMSMVDLVPLLEEAGRAALPLPLVETAAVGIPLLAQSTVPLAAEWLASAAAGNTLIAARFGDDPLVASADIADLILVADGDTIIGLPRDAARLTPRRSVDHTRRMFEVTWDQGVVLAEGAQGAAMAAGALNRGALASAAMLVGLGSRCLSMAVEYAGVREQFGKKIGTFQAIKHRCADALIGLHFARPLLWRAAWALSHDESDAALHVSAARSAACDAADVAARAALQVHGAIGYTTEYDLHLWMKRIWALSGVWGDARWHRKRAATFIFGESHG